MIARSMRGTAAEEVYAASRTELIHCPACGAYTRCACV